MGTNDPGKGRRFGEERTGGEADTDTSDLVSSPSQVLSWEEYSARGQEQLHFQVHIF